MRIPPHVNGFSSRNSGPRTEGCHDAIASCLKNRDFFNPVQATNAGGCCPSPGFFAFKIEDELPITKWQITSDSQYRQIIVFSHRKLNCQSRSFVFYNLFLDDPITATRFECHRQIPLSVCSMDVIASHPSGYRPLPACTL